MTVTAPAAAAYLARVGVGLADLAAAEREEMLEEVRGHVVALAADGDPVEARLGPPEAFAAEMRTAAGLPPLPGSAAAVARPADRSRWWLWWPAGGFLVGYAAGLPGVAGGGVTGVLVPRLAGHAVLAVLAILVSTAAATAVGAAAARWRQLLPVAVVGSGTLVAVALARLADVVRLLR